MAEQISVSELNRLVASYLSEPALRNVAVAGEVSGAKQYASGHFYFTLKDQNAQVSCIMFKSDVNRQGKTPQDGEAVVCKGRVSLYERGGIYQLQVRSIQDAGAGAIWQRFEALKKKLAAEGYFDVDHKQELPFIPRHIGLVTSQEGAVIRDILNVCRRRFPGVSYKLISVRVQGVGAAEQVARAISVFNYLNNVDLIIVARGGGSMEDLWAFNEPIVAKAVYKSAIPLISAVGHETDFTIADFVADQRAATPSAAAELAVPVRADLEKQLGNLRHSLEQSSRRSLRLSRERLAVLAQRLERGAERTLEQAGQRLDLLMAKPVFYKPETGLALRQSKLDDWSQRLRKAVQQRWELARADLRHLSEKLDLASPHKLLEKGYVLALDATARPLTTARSLEVGADLNLQFQDGLVKTLVEEINLFAENSRS